VPDSTIAFINPQEPMNSPHSDGFIELEVVVSHYLPRFYRKANQRLRNIHDAEDAVQDALLSACEHLAEFEGRSSLSTWVTSIVINAARLQLRRKRPARILVDQRFGDADTGITLEDAVPDERPGPHEILARAELHDQVAQSIRTLSPLLRKTLYHYYFDDMTAAELAGMLDLPVGTVKARISRARARLKCVLRARTAQRQPHNSSLD
jgi:RNA polymerase sigma-70 factor, ECF subfamily